MLTQLRISQEYGTATSSPTPPIRTTRPYGRTESKAARTWPGVAAGGSRSSTQSIGAAAELRMALRSRSSSTTMRTGRTRSPNRRLRSSRACWLRPVAITALAPIASATATPPLPKAPVAPFTRTVSPAQVGRDVAPYGTTKLPNAHHETARHRRAARCARHTPSARGCARPTNRREYVADAWRARCPRSAAR